MLIFTLNNGKSIPLGDNGKSIRRVIHDDTRAETPTSLAIAYTTRLFKELGLTEKPDFKKYKSLAKAICQSDIITRTELCSIGELISKAWP
jgi:hypothetical protein